MPDALPLMGLYGKVPAHGDFVRRGLPSSFVGPWDAWLQDGMAAARERLGDRWATLWDGAPPWRFALPAGACGPDAVAGVMLPSEDMVGRRFPLTLAALLPAGMALPEPGWFAHLEAAARAGRAGQADADALAAAVPAPDAAIDAMPRPVADAPDLPPVADGAAQAGGFLDIFGDAVPGQGGDSLPPAAVADVLDLFTGASADRTAAPPAWPMAEPQGAETADVLDLIGRVAPVPAEAAPATADGTLAFLLGEAAAAAPAEAAFTPPDTGSEPPPGDADPLAALIAAGAAPIAAAPLPDGLPEPPAPVAMPEPLETTPQPVPLPPAEAPAPPPGGGWWTGGGGRLPPTARAWPALLPAADFASLLEADA